MTPSARERLEAELQDRIDDATLAIYADHLQTLGDPRGELIALDLRGAIADDRRRELMHAWVGGDPQIELWAEATTWIAGHRDHTFATFDRGFMDIVHVDGDPETVVALLDGPAGRYLRRLTASHDPYRLREIIDALADAPRPWLEMMSLATEDSDTPTIDADLEARLYAATPRLELLDVSGGNVFRALAHPGVREIAVLGSRAIGLPDGPPMPNVRTLDIAFERDEPVKRAALEQLVTPSRFPALRRVRLGRCEPGARTAFRVLDALGVAPQLTHLRLPSVRSPADRDRVQAALDRLPNLRVVEIERAYSCFPHVAGELRHAVAEITSPMPRSWRPIDDDGDDADRSLLIGLVEVPLVTLVGVMEERYAELPTAVQDAWDQFWRAIHTDLAVDQQWPHERIWFPREVLASALAPVARDDADLASASEHVAELAHDTVEVAWG